MTDATTPPAGPPSQQPGSRGGGSDQTPIDHVTVRRVGRPWIPVLLAVLLLAGMLIYLLVPGVLRFPEDTARLNDQALLDAQQATNRALEDRIAELTGVLDRAVCEADNALFEQSQGRLLPLNPERLPPGTPITPPDALPAPPDAAERGLPDAETLVDVLDASTAFILAYTPNAQGGPQRVEIGSGVFVAPGRVLTNLHVLGQPPGQRIIVFSPRMGRPAQARLLADSGSTEPGTVDLALLEVEGADDVPPLPLAPEANRLQPVIAAGFPQIVIAGDEAYQAIIQGDLSRVPTLAFTDGIVTSTQRPQGVALVLHTATVSQGNSGGPLVDQCGRIVGLNSFVRSESTFRRLNYALSAETLRGFLAEHGVSPIVETNRCRLLLPESEDGAALPPRVVPQDATLSPGRTRTPGGSVPRGNGSGAETNGEAEGDGSGSGAAATPTPIEGDPGIIQRILRVPTGLPPLRSGGGDEDADASDAADDDATPSPEATTE